MKEVENDLKEIADSIPISIHNFWVLDEQWAVDVFPVVSVSFPNHSSPVWF